MFQELHVTNFGCFRELHVELKPLTVAIGQNNTGKSTFLDALALAAQHRGKRPVPREWSFRHLGEGGLLRASPVKALAREQILHFRLPSSGPRMTSPGVPDIIGPPLLEESGQGVPTLIDWMLRRDRRRFHSFVEAVRALVPGVTDVEVSTPTADQRSLQLVIEGGWTHPADGASAGVRLLLSFLALAWHPTPPELVLIEEPENGFHPERLEEVMRLIRGLVTGQHAPVPVQVVLTTHSPYLLSCIEVPQDQVLVFSRGADGACTAKPIGLEKIRPFQPGFALGEIWSNLGDAGLVEG
jgi:predicted ATPase